jgi:hypothetical protein
MAYTALGNTDSAFTWLDRGYSQVAGFMDAVAVAPAFERLHGDARWNALIQDMELPYQRMLVGRFWRPFDNKIRSSRW